MTTNEIKSASYHELAERLDLLLAHPETHWRVTDEVRAVELELMDRDLRAIDDKVTAEMMAGGLDWMMGEVA